MKIVICGAGIAGLALAQRLAAGEHEVVVLEKASGPRAQGYMIDFFGSGYDAAEAMGLVAALHAAGYAVEEAAYLDAAGRRRAGLNFRQFANTVQGRMVSIMRPDIERVLRESLPDEVDLRFGHTITQCDSGTDGVRVTLGDGSQLGADLLVGADGIHSEVRRLVFGEQQEYLRYLGLHTAAFLFDEPEIHAQIGGRFCLTDTVDRQVGFYALRDGTVAAFAVHRAPDPELPEDPRAAIQREYASLGWVVPRALASCPPSSEVYYDQVAQIDMPQWTTGRVTLVGDACQAVSLLAGQGASLAVGGAFVLAEQLCGDQSIDEALRRYETIWRPIVQEKQRVARSGASWFLPRSTVRLRLRRLAMKLGRVPGIDRYLAGALAGKSVALPR